MLTAQYPKAMKKTDKVGRLPVHSACSNRAPLDVIAYLLEEYPESITETTDRGVRNCSYTLCRDPHASILRFDFHRVHRSFVLSRTRPLYKL